MNKTELEIILSKLKGFQNPKVKLEQYITDATVAADIMWNAYHNKHINHK